jgi:flagellar motor switch protein FliG
LPIPFGRIEAQDPKDVARVIRTLLIENVEGKGFSGRQKVAILAIALGQSATARIMKHLNDYEIEDIAQAVAELKTVTSEQERETVEEIEQLLVAGKYVSMGGIDFARGALERALGPERARQMLDRVMASTTGGFYLLKNIAPNQIAPFISKEHPQTIALVLSQLESVQAAGVLNLLPEELQADVAYRLATLENISPQVLREIESSLAEELQTILTGQITEIGGPKKVAEILNLTGRTTEKAVLEKLDGRDQGLAEKVRNQMFPFDDIARLTDREVQLILKEVSEKDLAVALKGSKPEMQDRVFSNVSEAAAASIREEMKFSGPIRLSDVEETQLRIVQIARKLEEAGEIIVTRGATQDVFV